MRGADGDVDHCDRPGCNNKPKARNETMDKVNAMIAAIEAKLDEGSTGKWTVKEDEGNHWGMLRVDGPRMNCVGFTIATNVSTQEGWQTAADARNIAALHNGYRAQLEVARKLLAQDTPNDHPTIEAMLTPLAEALGCEL